MSELTFHLLGPPLIAKAGRSVRQPRRKAIALLAYLVVDRQPHSRDALATLLWPECGQSRARANLRRCIFALNEVVGAEVLVADQDTLRIAPDAVATDVEHFRRLASGCGKHDGTEICYECLDQFTEATSLYQNDFLFGFTLPDATDFDQWQLIQGERLRDELGALLRRVISQYEMRGAAAGALPYARRLLSLDPLEESSHRTLIRLLAQCGQRAAAYRQYEECRRILSEELGESPGSETVELISEVRAKAADDFREGATADGDLDHGWFAELTIGGLSPSNTQVVRQALNKVGAHSIDVNAPDPSALRARFSTTREAVAAALHVQGATDADLRIVVDSERQGEDLLPSDARESGGASLLLAIAPRGDILFSAAAVKRTKTPLPSGLSLRLLGYHRLTDLRAPEPVYQVLNPENVRALPSLETLDSRPNNLPTQTARLIGREKELSELAALITQPGPQTVTLTGPAGTGKTRLALQAAARVVGHFEHGVFFVDLAPISEPSDLLRAISSVLSVPESYGRVRPGIDILRDYLGGRSILLVLDNFEQLLPAAHQLIELLTAAPRLRTLVTSRQRLSIPSEYEYPVAPLSLPRPDAGDEVALLSEAERLFVNRARTVRPDLSITPETASAIARICIHLDGLPLAIELAAARLKVISAIDLEKMLPHRLAVLKSRSPSGPQRQLTLEKAIDWSYQLLDERERRLFARLSAFVGSFTLEAAEAVCSSDGSETIAIDVLDGLTSLVEKNMVRPVEDMHESRFALLETIRSYGVVKLREDEDANLVRERHAAYFRGLAESAETGLHGPGQMRWLERLERDYENLQVALRWHFDNQRFSEAMRICVALEWFWYRYAHFSDAKKWLRLSLESGAFEPAWIRGRVCRVLGWFHFVQGDWAGAGELYRKAVRLSRESEDRRNEILSLLGLGTVERWLGAKVEGDRYAEASVDMARETQDPLLITLALIWAYATTGGKFGSTPPVSELEEALEMARGLGDSWCEAHVFNGLGDLYTETGDYLQARASYERALEGFRNLRDGWLEAWTLEGLGRVSLLAGDLEAAYTSTRASISLFDSLGDRANVVPLLGRLGVTLSQSGRPTRAAAILGAYDSLSRQIGRTPSSASPPSDVASACSAVKSASPEGWAAGRVMSYEQALAYVMASTDVDGLVPSP